MNLSTFLFVAALTVSSIEATRKLRGSTTITTDITYSSTKRFTKKSGTCGGKMNKKKDDIFALTPFTSTFYVAYAGPTGPFQGNAITTVETVHRDTYNQVIGCAREILLDSVVINNQTYYPPINRNRNLAYSRSFSLVNSYSVSGTCRSCSSGTKLFNDAVRRRFLQTLAASSSSRSNSTALFNAASLVNLNAAGITQVTSVSATNAVPLTLMN